MHARRTIALEPANGTPARRCAPALGLAATLAAAAAAPAHAQWTITDLHRAGYENSVALGIADGVVVGYVGDDLREELACVWSDLGGGSFVLLHEGLGATRANGAAGGAAGGVQVGTRDVGFSDFRAVLWRGSPASVVDMHPPGAMSSGILCTDGARHGGVVDNDAAVWTGDTGAYTLLHDGLGIGSAVLAMHGQYQAGRVLDAGHAPDWHAALWRGTPDSLVDLHPAGHESYDSSVRAIYSDPAGGPGEQGGELNRSLATYQAALWRGTAASYVDLHEEDDWRNSRVNGVYDRWQVGEADPSFGGRRAMLWRGSKESRVDLHDLVRPRPGSSRALGVWHDGTTLHIVGEAGGRATVWSRPLCLADLDADGELTVFDFLAFTNAFDAGETRADYDGDGVLTIFDFLAFQSAFDAGC